MNIYPFIMAGGEGKRLWPLSTGEMPKQFLPLLSDKSLLQQTLARLEGADFEVPSVIGSVKNADILKEQCGDTGAHVYLEAQSKGTAFSVALAAHAVYAKDKNAVLLVLPCDHYIEESDKLINAVRKAVDIAFNDGLALIGVAPQTPSTEYGYIQKGDHKEADTYNVKAFKEKPNRETALQYLESGQYLWNSGIFVFSAACILNALKRHAGDIYSAAKDSFYRAEMKNNTYTLPVDMQKCLTTSIDYALLEKLENECAVVPLETGWNDLGTWASLWKHLKSVATADTVQRDWGHYKVLSRGPGYLIKALRVDPKASLSVQYHHHRAEHWVVVEGQVQVLKDAERFSLGLNESAYIDIRQTHQIANDANTHAEIIEVQLGEHLCEDDIVRL